MYKTYDLCDLTTQQTINLYQRIKSKKYHSIMLFDKKYYDDNKYVESNIQSFNSEMLDYIIDNMSDIRHYGIVLKNNLILYGRYIKAWW